ncbi:uncharacterized RING finger protein P32A8.03c-like [Branchiostoma floridae]|uniref:Uncharacterized RING finger protein P32A8.03c-like n=1 Tax=Branchiostoma floridae TaxID=7739 RepID=A0A9J7HW67_BRAFL|nr:uncharacterized RING finger protein P32A8.03c-like [Branchiostoma floridae]
MVVAVSIMVFLWFTQVHRYLYNVLYGPFVLSEQEIVDTTRRNLWKQYVQAEQEARRRREQEEVTRRHREQDEEIRRHRGEQDEAINAFFASLDERADERPATEGAVGEMRQSCFTLELDSEENCVICQDGMKEGEKVIKFPCPAKHQYHKDCLLQWLQRGSSCPVCRHQVQSRRQQAAHVFRLVFM